MSYKSPIIPVNTATAAPGVSIFSAAEDHDHGISGSGLDHGLLTGLSDDDHAQYALSGTVGSSRLTMNTARLLGRTTASAGAVEEITVGSGLSLSAGALTATGGGMAIGGTVTGGVATHLLYVDTGPVLAQNAYINFENESGIGGTTTDLVLRHDHALWFDAAGNDGFGLTTSHPHFHYSGNRGLELIVNDYFRLTLGSNSLDLKPASQWVVPSGFGFAIAGGSSLQFLISSNGGDLYEHARNSIQFDAAGANTAAAFRFTIAQGSTSDVTLSQHIIDQYHIGLNKYNPTAVVDAVITDAITTVGIRVKAKVGQTGNLQEWLDSSNIPLLQVLAGGQIKTASGNETTGGGTALFGTNSPAVTNTAPYTWLKFTSSDGSQVYVPAWK